MSASQIAIMNIDYVPFFEEQINLQREAIVSFKRWMGGFVFAGMLIILCAVVFNKSLPGVASQIVGVGGVFIGALAAFPYREIIPRRSRIVTYNLLKSSFERLDNYSAEDQQRLKALADETIKKTI